MVDEVTSEVLHVCKSDQVLHVDNMAKDGLVLYTVKSADTRVTISLAHVIKVKNSAGVAKALRQVVKGYGAATSITREEEVKSYPAFYLGFHRVAKTKGTAIVAKALTENMSRRAEFAGKRRQFAQPKSCTLTGASSIDGQDDSCVIEQHPVVLVLTARSLRIVDVVAGDTVQKFHIHQVSRVARPCL